MMLRKHYVKRRAMHNGKAIIIVGCAMAVACHEMQVIKLRR